MKENVETYRKSCFLMFPVLVQEKEGPKIGGETLLVRGEELPKFLNSLKQQFVKKIEFSILTTSF